jgi:predicted esterase
MFVRDNMPNPTYTNLTNRALELYRQERFWEAYQLVTSHMGRMPDCQAHLYDFRCSLACRAGKADIGMDVLREAVLEKGYWYGKKYLLEDQDMASLREHPGFSRIVELCERREREAKAGSRSELVTVRSEDRRACDRPLIVVLHGNMQNASIAREDWSSMMGTGYDLAFVQSSQVTFSGGYVWNDLETGKRDLLAQWQALRSRGTLDGREAIIAGFSAGSRLSLFSVLNDLIKVRGMVLVGPWLPELQEWKGRIPELRSKVAWTYAMCGENDPECLPMARGLAELLEAAGAPSELRTIPGLDHDYPSDFGAKLIEFMAKMG